MPSTESAKKFGKRVIAYPEETVPVISTTDWFRERSFDPRVALVPIFGWISRYNLGWLSGDVIAGLTVGMVLVPQGMSYAQIATLSPEYGLYSSFVGVLIYCLFATSKDVSIGPVAVMSLTVSQIINSVESAHPGQWEAPLIATTVAFVCGFIVLGIGLLRLGWIVDFIPAPAISGFMTGSAISIVAGQVPGLMGISGFDTRESTYKVIINTLKHLPSTSMDAAFGLPALVFLYGFRIICDKLSKRYPKHSRLLFFASVLRNAVTILVLTIAAWLYCRHNKDAAGSYPIKILKDVPSGFQHIGQPVIDKDLISALAGELPVATIILLLEHIAISKSFGRVNGYKINPNQELIAIGVTNLVGSCFNAYPATGSFSRSALKSKCGVRTPAAGIITAVVVLVALYGLTPAFFWIPSAALSAVIIHAVADLVASPAQVYSYWRVAPLEFVIWLAAVLITIFTTIENGIYASICASLALLLIRVAHPRGKFLGKVVLRRGGAGGGGALPSPGKSFSSSQTASVRSGYDGEYEREVFVPLASGSQTVDVIPPAPGVVIYRFEESYLYPNSAVMNERIVDYVRAHTRRGKDLSTVSMADRPWNDPGTRKGSSAEEEQRRNEALPLLRAVVLDFSSISHIDTTAVQSLIDTRNEIERWTDAPVEFHFASILSPWIRRALVAGGFGFVANAHDAGRSHEVAPVVPYRDGLREGDPETSPQLHHDLESRLHHDLESRLHHDRESRLHHDLESRGADIVEQAREQTRERLVSHTDLKRVDLKTARVDLKTAGVDLKTASVDLKTAGVDLKTAGVDLKTTGVVTEMEVTPLITEETPFFHLDLQEAVRAAEGGLQVRRVPSYR
ncbi:sulfate transporter family-domain-containing protein [Schizophyllum amplum]|uniref:Sulfate transporter family-domain-containing protein n=1 Tax=Schizophyllum amplum TaxID=97359 RepID=A0A550BWD7_9AGAR|nr:sulfate transporter family-domain-containing protein [Auriculariopsis ampla]